VKPVPKCPHCGSQLLSASQWERDQNGLGPEVQWLCHNDYCPLNHKSAGREAAESAVFGVGMLIRFGLRAVKILVPLGVAWLIWRSL